MTLGAKCAALIHLVRRNLQLVAVGIAEINRVRDFVILEFEFDSALFQFPLRSTKIFVIRAKGKMKHSNFALRRRFRLLFSGEQGDPGVSFAYKSWHTIPHAFVKSLEPENVDVPFGRSFNVAHAHGYVINTFELHEMLDRIYRIRRDDKGGTRCPQRVGKWLRLCRLILNSIQQRETAPSAILAVIAFREVDPPSTYSCPRGANAAYSA
jgi:hypothetical protein